MARLELPYVQRFRDRHGKVRHYFRKLGCKRVPLPGVPGSEEFMTAYKEAEKNSRSIGEQRVAAGSIAALITAYYQSAGFKLLQPETQRTARRILDKFRTKYGTGPAAQFGEQHLRRILDQVTAPWGRKNLLKRLRLVFRFGLERNLVSQDPTRNVKVAVPKTDGFRAWTEADVEKFEQHWPPGSRARLALYLLIYTGQRRQDVVRMGRQHVRAGSIAVRQLKTKAELTIQLHPALKAELDRLPTDNLTFVTTASGKPFSKAGFSNWFSDCAREAGLPHNSSPHGLRKAAARRLAEAGCSAMQIAAVTGHASLKEVERYTRSAAQHRLAADAINSLPRMTGTE